MKKLFRVTYEYGNPSYRGRWCSSDRDFSVDVSVETEAEAIPAALKKQKPGRYHERTFVKYIGPAFIHKDVTGIFEQPADECVAVCYKKVVAARLVVLLNKGSKNKKGKKG